MSTQSKTCRHTWEYTRLFVWIVLDEDLIFAGLGVPKKPGMPFVGFAMQDELLMGSDLHRGAIFNRAELSTGLTESMTGG